VTTRRGRERAAAWERRHPDLIVPAFFVGRDLDAPRARLRRGELWESQDRRVIRLWGEAFGVRDAETCSWHELPHVITLNCPTMDLANEVIAKGMNLEQAQEYVDAWLEAKA
jgi:hypothetical protein